MYAVWCIRLFAHLHTCTSRPGNSAARSCRCIFRIVGVSSAGGSRTLLPSLSISVNKPLHHLGINTTETVWHSPNGHVFTSVQGEAVDALAVYTERSIGLFPSRLQLLFPFWSLSLLKHNRAKRKNMHPCVFYSTFRLLCFNSRLDGKEKLLNSHAAEMPIASIVPSQIENGWWDASLVMSCWSTSHRLIHQSMPTLESVRQLALTPSHTCTCARLAQLVFKRIHHSALKWDWFFSQSHHASKIYHFIRRHSEAAGSHLQLRPVITEELFLAGW